VIDETPCAHKTWQRRWITWAVLHCLYRLGIAKGHATCYHAEGKHLQAVYLERS
jgi:hypothetical protein